MQVPYLSDEWLAAIDGELAARDRLRSGAAAAEGIGLTQVVRATDGGERVYHVTSHGGAVRAGWGPADPEDVRVTTDRATAAAVASGSRNAAEAFIRGEVHISGDPARLLAARDLLAALDDVMAEVTARTRFDDA